MPKKKIEKNILKEFDLEGLEEKKQIRILELLTEMMLKRITIRVLERLSDEGKNEFDEIRETENPEKIAQFLKDRISDFDEMAEKEITDFKREIKADINGLKKSLAE